MDYISRHREAKGKIAEDKEEKRVKMGIREGRKGRENDRRIRRMKTGRKGGKFETIVKEDDGKFKEEENKIKEKNDD